MQHPVRALLSILGLTCLWTAVAQQPSLPAVGAAPKAATEKDRVAASEPAQSPGAAAPAALSEPAILVAADREDATAKVLLQGLEAAPAEGDLEVGMLTSVQQPNVLIRPTVTFISTTASDKTDKTPDFLTKLTFHGLVSCL